MPDETFDAVIVGGGTTALFTAMYLMKYGGMSVGIFERRHEIGGCLSTEEAAAPGFRGNQHATMMFDWYHLPFYRDFPEFWDYGDQHDQYLVADGAAFRKDQTCIAIYSRKHDPTQERTAKEIARFSERDAEQWLKFWNVWTSDDAQRVQIDRLFLPAEDRAAPELMERQLALYPKLVEAGFEPDSLYLAASHLRSMKEMWESPELQYCIARIVLSGAFDVSHTGVGVETIGYAMQLPGLGFCRGGTHQIAHAAHKILVSGGVKFFTHAEVDRVIIENGTAKGIRLTDGSEIKARKLVLSTLNPRQLCFDLIGREHLDEKTARRVELTEASFGCLMWYSFACHDRPRYEAAAFNPDINETFWLGLAETPDPDHIARETYFMKLGLWPPPEDFCPTVWSHSMVDPSYAPKGKFVCNNEQVGPPASSHTEKEWLKLKKWYAEQLIELWSKHAPNMNWDNIIGYDPNTPYDNLRMKNLAPNGAMSGDDRPTYQSSENRPTPELANHRTPIKNLYCTGGSWWVGTNIGGSECYNCYRIIAKDLNLGKPWEEQGKEEPDSLIQSMRWRDNKIRDTFKRDDLKMTS
jgi:beta-carotene ketolase (CrtO type)